MADKVVLAFSGGLDTSFCTLFLQEQGFDVITATIDTGGLPQEELSYIANRSKELGAKAHVHVDAQKEIFDEITSYMIKANGLYEGVYPNMCADRYTIAKHCVKIAGEQGAVAVAHGCTGAGNDQVRMDATISSLAPHLQIVAPIRKLMITRDKEIEYLENKGFAVPAKAKQYTINENVYGRTMSGSEIDENSEPKEEAYVLTRVSKRDPEYFDISFAAGVPIALNGTPMHGSQMLQALNAEAGAHGYGRGYYVEDTTIGLKGFQAFEAPGMLLLIEAHKSLERMVLTKRQLSFKAHVDAAWADFAFSGLLYEPLVSDLHAFLDHNQVPVTGTVKMKVDGKNAMSVHVESAYSLINEEIGSYAQKGSWKGEEAEGFIRFYTLQQKIASLRENAEK